MVLQSNAYTSWVSERLVKEKSDIDIIARYATQPLCDCDEVNRHAAARGEGALIRGFMNGFDVYGHAPGDPLEPGEYAPDHGKPIPIGLPDNKDLAFGAHWSGSPFLGQHGPPPPNQGMLNPNGGFYYMWHPHSEKELTNNDVFPGGCMTMLAIEHPAVPIMENMPMGKERRSR